MIFQGLGQALPPVTTSGSVPGNALYQNAVAMGMSDATAQMYLPFPQNATACEADKYYTKDPNGKFLFNSSMFPAAIIAGGIAAMLFDHTIIGAALVAFGLNELPVWGCNVVGAGNTCPGYTQCTSFICRNGGCGF